MDTAGAVMATRPCHMVTMGRCMCPKHRRSCGLLLDRRQGQWVYYRLNPKLPAWVREVLETTLTANSEWLASNTRRLSTMDGRPLNTTACC